MSLLDKRNAIAHGRDVPVEEDDYLILMDNVMNMMSEFRNQIDNAASLGKYKR